MNILNKKEKYNVGIIGSTGLVGRTLLKELEKDLINIDNLYLFGSKHSKNKTMKFKEKQITVNEFTNKYYDNIDIYFFCANNEISRKHILNLINKRCLIIDNSSEFRLIKNVPLVIPELNFEKALNKKLICNPNCSTIEAVMVLGIIDKIFPIKKIIYSTYQAVSGSGIDGVIDYYHNTKKIYPFNIKSSCLPVIGKLSRNNHTTEEIKMIDETKKILNKNIPIEATCVRVPILIGHGISIYIESKNKIDINKIKKELLNYPNIIISDDINNNIYPTAIHTLNNSNIYVGRIKQNNKYSLSLFIYANNLLTGAATNSLNICKKYIENIKT